MQQVRLTLTTRKPEAYHIASILDPQFEEDGITSVLFEEEGSAGEWSYSIYVDEQGLSRGAQPLTGWFDEINEAIAGEWHSTYAQVREIREFLERPIIQPLLCSTYVVRGPRNASLEPFLMLSFKLVFVLSCLLFGFPIP